MIALHLWGKDLEAAFSLFFGEPHRRVCVAQRGIRALIRGWEAVDQTDASGDVDLVVFALEGGLKGF